MSQRLNGADGYLLYADCIGAPATYCTEASKYAVGCILFQRDSSTLYTTVIWKNTGTVASPTWTQQGVAAPIAAGSTKTLLAPQSGSTILLDTATGSVVTLPAPTVGLRFTFIVSVTVTSNSHKVITNAGTVYMVGMVALMEAAATSAVGCLFNGTSHVAITMNGTTTGGIIGTRFTLECISTTVWELSGLVAGSGSLTTPAATS